MLQKLFISKEVVMHWGGCFSQFKSSYGLKINTGGKPKVMLCVLHDLKLINLLMSTRRRKLLTASAAAAAVGCILAT